MRVDNANGPFGFAVVGAGNGTGLGNDDEAAGKAGFATQGDTADISEEGRALAARLGGARDGSDGGGGTGVIPVGKGAADDDEDDKEQEIKLLEDKIEKTRRELKEVQQDESMSEDQKRLKIMELTQRLMDLTTELAKTKGYGAPAPEEDAESAAFQRAPD